MPQIPQALDLIDGLSTRRPEVPVVLSALASSWRQEEKESNAQSFVKRKPQPKSHSGCFKRQTTNTPAAIRDMSTAMFTYQNGDRSRSFAPHSPIITTDGVPRQ
jgi:hypothetical protein